MRIMGSRAESQVSRDWNFGFVSWTYVCHSSLNMSRNIFAFDHLSKETGMLEFTAEDLQEGAKQIGRAMWGKYTDINDRQQSVLGDMTKVRYVKRVVNGGPELADKSGAHLTALAWHTGDTTINAFRHPRAARPLRSTHFRYNFSGWEPQLVGNPFITNAA